MTHTITFFPDGTARALHPEAVPLHELGPLTIRRASTVDFNPETHKWEVRLTVPACPCCKIEGEVQFSNASRQACLEWERAFFEGVGSCLLEELPHATPATENEKAHS